MNTPEWVMEVRARQERDELLTEIRLAIARRAPAKQAMTRFVGQAPRVDRVLRAALLAGGADGDEVGPKVDAVLVWARRQWPLAQSQVLHDAWQAAKGASGGDQGAAAAAFAEWLRDVRQRVRAGKASGGAT